MWKNQLNYLHESPKSYSKKTNSTLKTHDDPEQKNNEGLREKTLQNNSDRKTQLFNWDSGGITDDKNLQQKIYTLQSSNEKARQSKLQNPGFKIHVYIEFYRKRI